ncbi:MAG: lipoprotein signal peptidase [marine bacterium B5-7]|nr:MAG: lipoprotein signal peptidase [marine bacterium B5-7]
MRRAFIVFTLVSSIVVVIDQLTKWLAESKLFAGDPFSLTGFLNLTLVYNRGAAFGFLNDQSGWQVALFSIIAIAVIGYMIYHIRSEVHSNGLVIFAYGMIAGGAVGNLIDRLAYGYVIDFIDFYIREWHFWIFNMADSALTVGVVLLFAASFFESRTSVSTLGAKEQSTRNAASESPGQSSEDTNHL